MKTFRFEAIGTVWNIDIYQDLEEVQHAALLFAIQTRIDVFDKAYSRFRDDSLVTTMSKAAGTYVLPPDAAYSFAQKHSLASPVRWSDALDYQVPNLVVRQPVMLDFGAAGKGYLIDLVGEVIESYGIDAYCIDAGGDILYKNQTVLRVGLEHPQHPEQIIGVYELHNGSICGSAGNRRVWNTFTHIINPKTKTSPMHILGVWVVAQTTLVADALATALFFVAADSLRDGYEFEYLIVYSDHSLEKSPGFTAELF